MTYQKKTSYGVVSEDEVCKVSYGIWVYVFHEAFNEDLGMLMFFLFINGEFVCGSPYPSGNGYEGVYFSTIIF